MSIIFYIFWYPCLHYFCIVQFSYSFKPDLSFFSNLWLLLKYILFKPYAILSFIKFTLILRLVLDVFKISFWKLVRPFLSQLVGFFNGFNRPDPATQEKIWVFARSCPRIFFYQILRLTFLWNIYTCIGQFWNTRKISYTFYVNLCKFLIKTGLKRIIEFFYNFFTNSTKLMDDYKYLKIYNLFISVAMVYLGYLYLPRKSYRKYALSFWDILASHFSQLILFFLQCFSNLF